MFKTAPVLRACQKSGQWTLERPLVWDDGQEIIVVPPGFRTDLASIPQAIQSLVPVNGKHRAAAILHDCLFVIQDRDRSAVDALFLLAMEACGVRWAQRILLWSAVRLGGWLPWQRNARALVRDRQAFLKSHGLDR